MNNETLLKGYLLNLISISTGMLKNIELFEVEQVEQVGQLVTKLNDFRLTNYIELPF